MTPTRLAPALPPIPGSEASAPPTPTPSHRSLIPSREPPQSLAAAIERIAVIPSQSLGNVSGSSEKSSESGYVSAPESAPVKPRTREKAPKNGVPRVPVFPAPSTPTKGPTIDGKEIGRPVLNMGACCVMGDYEGHAEQTGWHMSRRNAEAQPHKSSSRAHAHPR
jgi:hypothetical protein